MVTMKADWEGPVLRIESRMNLGGRDFHFVDFWSLSADGRVLTMEHRDDDLAGQVAVLDKVADGV